MDPQTSSLATLLGRRLSLLQLLAHDLKECRPAFVHLKVDLIESHIFRQKSLCEQISELNRQIKIGQFSPCTTEDVARFASSLANELASAESAAELLTQTKIATDEVRKLNQIHKHFLRGSARTLKALSNLVASYSLTYEMPGRAHISVGDGPGS